MVYVTPFIVPSIHSVSSDSTKYVYTVSYLFNHVYLTFPKTWHVALSLKHILDRYRLVNFNEWFDHATTKFVSLNFIVHCDLLERLQFVRTKAAELSTQLLVVLLDYDWLFTKIFADCGAHLLRSLTRRPLLLGAFSTKLQQCDLFASSFMSVRPWL